MVNEKYSYKSWKRKSFKTVNASEFSNSEIIGACFYQEIPYSNIFPSGITNCIFTKCNLDNCEIPEGCTINRGTNKHIKLQKDGEYWIVDKSLNPIEPRDKQKFIDFGLSIDPKNLPTVNLIEPILFINDPKIIEQKKIQDLSRDSVRLKDILQEKGEL